MELWASEKLGAGTRGTIKTASTASTAHSAARRIERRMPMPAAASTPATQALAWISATKGHDAVVCAGQRMLDIQTIATTTAAMHRLRCATGWGVGWEKERRLFNVLLQGDH